VSNELKTRIYQAVKAAAASGHLTEMEIAQQVGETVTKGEGEKAREVVSIALTNAIEVMTSKKWLRHLVIKASKGNPRRNVLIPGPVPMPPLPKDEEVCPGPPLKVWVDPSVIDPAAGSRVRPSWVDAKKEPAPEVVPIAVPAALKPVAAKQPAIAAVAAPPEAVSVVKVAPSPVRLVGDPEERAIAAWEQMIDSGDRFAQRDWIYRANLGSRSTMGPRWHGVYDAVKDAVGRVNQGQPLAQFRGVVAAEVAKMPRKFTVSRKKDKPVAVMPSVLEQLKAEAETLDAAFWLAKAEADRAVNALNELIARKDRVAAAIAALEGDNV
jgi:hypothetical protein